MERCGFNFDYYTFENLLNKKKVYTYNNKRKIICYIFIIIFFVYINKKIEKRKNESSFFCLFIFYFSYYCFLDKLINLNLRFRKLLQVDQI